MANFARFTTYPIFSHQSGSERFGMAQNDSEWPISPNSQLFQTFPTKVAQNDLKQPISPDSQLFQSFPTEVAQNDLEWLRMTQNSQQQKLTKMQKKARKSSKNEILIFGLHSTSDYQLSDLSKKI